MKGLRIPYRIYMECTQNDLWVTKDKAERQAELRNMKERRYMLLVNADTMEAHM
jgi:hypothetical protein